MHISEADSSIKNKIIYDRNYRLKFINEIVRKLDDFDVIFTNIYKTKSFHWKLFEKNIDNLGEFNIFGFGRRNCIAENSIIKVYEQFVIKTLSRYNISVNIRCCNIKDQFAYVSILFLCLITLTKIIVSYIYTVFNISIY